MARKIEIRYFKAYDFKAFLATGVYGGISGNGLINANFFTDRVVIPNSQIVEIDENGIPIGQPVDSKEGDLAREVQTALLMDVGTAKIVVAWLQSRIKEHEDIINKP